MATSPLWPRRLPVHFPPGSPPWPHPSLAAGRAPRSSPFWPRSSPRPPSSIRPQGLYPQVTVRGLVVCRLSRQVPYPVVTLRNQKNPPSCRPHALVSAPSNRFAFLNRPSSKMRRGVFLLCPWPWGPNGDPFGPKGPVGQWGPMGTNGAHWAHVICSAVSFS